MSIVESLRKCLLSAGQFNTNDQEPPIAILWPDKDRQWVEIVSAIRGTMPHLLTLSDSFDLVTRSGPAVWIRCMLARSLPETSWPKEQLPIVYMPGVSRSDFRAIESSAEPMLPLMETQFRSVFWSQVNGKDWTLFAFLSSEDGGLGLDLAKDAQTLEALRVCSVYLLKLNVAELSGKRLEASDFHELLSPDPVRQLLAWMNDPEATKSKLSPGEWAAFCNNCKDRFKFDPRKQPPLKAAQLAGERKAEWVHVWNRFREAPQRFPSLPDWLRKAKPHESDDLFLYEEAWPQSNETQETVLRTALGGLRKKSEADAITLLQDLEKTHAGRREWVWADLGQAPLACALKPLHEMAVTAKAAIPANTLEALSQWYRSEGNKVDAAVLKALATVDKPDDVRAITAAIRSVYIPWLDRAAAAFQKLFAPAKTVKPLHSDDGTVIFFADGLRFDLAVILQDRLRSGGLHVTLSSVWSALPSVTPTAKPAVSPVSQGLVGGSGEDFRPSTPSNTPLTPDRFRSLLSIAGYQILSGEESGNPGGKAWTECGHIDSTGHNEGWRLAKRVDEEISSLAHRVQSLLTAGWKEVRVVTDHGWLLVPDGLPKVELPKYLADTRWGRCARIKENVKSELPVVPWSWDQHQYIAVAPGISAFRASMEYAHGGLSLQECFIPQMSVQAKTSSAFSTISSVRWVKRRCRVHVANPAQGLIVDIRNDNNQSVADQPKEVEADGEAAPLVSLDELAGTPATVVLISPTGQIISQEPTTIPNV